MGEIICENCDSKFLEEINKYQWILLRRDLVDEIQSIAHKALQEFKGEK